MGELKNQATGNYPWMVYIRRSDLAQQIKAVAFVLATYADADGSGACVGQKRLADEAICDERYARDSLEALELLGLIEVTKRGRSAGDASSYQLTMPAAGLPAIPMRRDRDGYPINADGAPHVGKRAKPAALRPLLAVLKGDPVPDRPLPDVDRTGNPVPVEPVDNSEATGNPVPLRLVDNSEVTAEYRQSVAGTEPGDADPYRQNPGAVPAKFHDRTGNGLPPTNLYQLLPTTSPQVTHSPTADDQACGQPDEVVAEEDPELTTARATLDALSAGAARAWRRAAQTELETAGVPLTHRAVAIRAAELATAPHTTEKTGT
ncbi:MAG TPA: hypothetical protein VGD91_19435 [Trebonia sp.]